MNKIRIIIRFLCLVFLLYCLSSEIDDTLISGIIPAPTSMERQNGQFFLNHSVSIFYNDDDLKATADYLARKFEDFLSIKSNLSLNENLSSMKKGIYLQLDTSMINLGSEGYRMIVSGKKIKVNAGSPAGIFYGIQSLLQLIDSNNNGKNKRFSVPAVVISDHPRFSWRGMPLGVS